MRILTYYYTTLTNAQLGCRWVKKYIINEENINNILYTLNIGESKAELQSCCHLMLHSRFPI